MENKDVKRMFAKLHKKLGRPMLDFEMNNAQLGLSILETQYEQLEKENSYYKSTIADIALKLKTSICDGYNEIDTIVAIDDLQLECEMLKQQLTAKDKELDKSIGECITSDSCLGCPCDCGWGLSRGSDECIKRIKE